MKSTTRCSKSLKAGGLALSVALALWAAGERASVAHKANANTAGVSVVQDTAGIRINQDRSTGDHKLELLATVNGQAVTRDELRRVLVDLNTLSQPHHQPHQESPDIATNYEELERAAFRQLIQRRLILQEAARQQLTVSGKELDQAISELRSRFADLGTFGVWMQERGLDDRSLLDTLRDDMLIKHLLALLVEDVTFTEEDVQDYYTSHKEDLSIGEEVRLRIIVVKSEAAAKEILTALREGENFSRLARKHSLGLRAAQGGDTGWVKAGTLTPPLRRVVDILKPGEASSPLKKNADEFLIVALVGQRPVQAKDLYQALPEIERRLLATRQQETVQAWLTEQEHKSNIEVFPQPNELFPSSRMTLNDHDGI